MSNRTALSLFALLAVLFHFDKVMLGAHGLVRLHDTVDSEWPRFFNYGNLVLANGPFAWYPHQSGGLPAYATHHSPCYPLAVACALVPPWLVYHGLVLALMALAGYGMFRFAGEVLGAESSLALLAGLVFALASQTQWSSLPVSIFSYLFPLFYVLVERGGEPGKPTGWGSLVGLAVLMTLAYPILTVHFFFVHAMVLALLDERGPRGLRLGRAVAVWTGYSLFCAATLVTLLRFVPLAQRDYLSDPLPMSAVLSDALRMLVIFLVDTTGDALGSPFLIMGLLLLGRSARVRHAWGMVLVVMGLALLGGSKASILISGTFLRRLDLFHCLRGLPFLVLVLGVVALQELRKLPPRDRLVAVAVAGLGLAAMPYGLEPIEGPPLTLMNAGCLLMAAAWLTGGEELAWATARRRGALVAGALGILLAMGGSRLLRLVEERHSWWANLGPIPALARLALESSGGAFRAAGWAVEPEVLQLHGLETIDAYGPLYFRRFKAAFRLLVEGQFDSPQARDEFDLKWNQLLLFPRENRGQPWLNVAWLGAMNVRYLVAGERLVDSRGLRLVQAAEPESGEIGVLARLLPGLSRLARRGPLHIYAVEAWLPRAYAVAGVRVLPDGPAVLAALGAASAQELARTAWLEPEEAARAALPASRAPASGGTAEIVEYGPDRIRVAVDAAGPGLLVVSNNWHPGWEAEVDGRPQPVLRANHTFQAVAFPGAGPHRIELRFRDSWLPWLHLLEVAGGLLMLAAARRPSGRAGTTPA